MTNTTTHTFSFFGGLLGCMLLVLIPNSGQGLNTRQDPVTRQDPANKVETKTLPGQSSEPSAAPTATQGATATIQLQPGAAQPISDASTQGPAVPQSAKAPPADWVERFELLERRVQEMEQILLTTSQITALEAERRLRDAKARLADSRQLFLRGQIAEIEFQNDRFEVDRLSRELEIARGTNQRHQAMSQIEIANAEQQLFAAEQQLEETQTLVRRGYMGATQLDRDREYVALASRRLEIAKQRLEAAKRLDELNRGKAGDANQTPKD